MWRDVTLLNLILWLYNLNYLKKCTLKNLKKNQVKISNTSFIITVVVTRVRKIPVCQKRDSTEVCRTRVKHIL